MKQNQQVNFYKTASEILSHFYKISISAVHSSTTKTVLHYSTYMSVSHGILFLRGGGMGTNPHKAVVSAVQDKHILKKY